MNRGAIVLCGGESRRMGRDKASLPFGQETLLLRAVRLATTAVQPGPVVCVAGVTQQIAPLPQHVTLLRDMAPSRGPVPAIMLGLAALQSQADLALTIACDTPLLSLPLVEYLFQQAEGKSAAAVKLNQRGIQPLPAVYATQFAEEPMPGNPSLRALLQQARSELVSEAEARLHDSKLYSFLNCNDPAAYQQAQSIAAHTGDYEA